MITSRPPLRQASAGAHRRGKRTALACTAAAAAVLAVAGCSSPVSGSAAVVPPATTAPTNGPTTAPTRVGAPSSAAAASADELAAQMRPYLLVPEEVGPGFTPGPEPLPDASAPAICGGPGVVAQFPNAVRVGASSLGPVDGVFLQQTMSLYPDVDTAAAAYRATVDGLDCSEGSLPEGPVVLTPAEDLAADVPADEATGWQIGGAGFDLILIAVRSGELVVNFAFVAPEGSTTEPPDPLAISRAGVEKLGG